MDIQTMADLITDTYVNGLMEEEEIDNLCWSDSLPYVLMPTHHRIANHQGSMLQDVIENLEANFNMDVSGVLISSINARMIKRAYDRMRRLRYERATNN